MTPANIQERRSGQRRGRDRRAAGRREQRLLWFLWCVGILNYVDAAQTIWLLNMKMMIEANRLMAFLLDHSPYGFWIYKTLVPSFGCVLLWRYRRKVKWLYGAVIAVVAIYFSVVTRSFLYMLLPIPPTV